MLLLKDRVVYQANKLYIEYNHKGDIDIYSNNRNNDKRDC